MSIRRQVLFPVISLLMCTAALADDMSGMTAQNPAQMKFMNFPVMPTCATGAVVNGDPSKGSSIILAKAKAGCVFPWHWHTPNEHLMIVSGSAKLSPKDGKPTTLTAGGFALMASKHVHMFRCATACTLYVYSDAAFDMHYVNDKGDEIPADDALKAVHEKAPAEMK